MSTATTRGTIMKTEFTWIIKDTFKWPEKEEDSLDSPLFCADGDKEIKWGLKIKKHPQPSPIYLNLFLYLSESPATNPTVTTRFILIVSDEKEGEFVCEKKASPVAITINSLSDNERLVMGKRDDFLKISSVSISVIVEYEKGQLETTTSRKISRAQPKIISVCDPYCWSQDLKKLFTSQTGSDICFIIEGQEIKAHKTILSARSPVFAAMFQSEMKEKRVDQIDIPEIAPNIFSALLRFIYTDQVQLTETNVEAILAVANQYLVLSLKTKCEEFIGKNLKIENCIEMLVLADEHNAQHLKRMTKEFFRSHQSEIRKIECWKTLKVSHPDVAFDLFELLLDS